MSQFLPIYLGAGQKNSGKFTQFRTNEDYLYLTILMNLFGSFNIVRPNATSIKLRLDSIALTPLDIFTLKL